MPEYPFGSTTCRGQRLDSGNLQELIDTKSVVGVTTNPSIFQKALAEGDAYDGQIAELADAAPMSTPPSGRSPPTTCAGRATC